MLGRVDLITYVVDRCIDASREEGISPAEFVDVFIGTLNAGEIDEIFSNSKKIKKLIKQVVRTAELNGKYMDDPIAFKKEIIRKILLEELLSSL